MKNKLLTFATTIIFTANVFAHGGGHCSGGHSGHCSGHSHGGVFIAHSGGAEIDFLPHYGIAQVDGIGTVQGVFQYAWFEFPSPNFKFYGNDSVEPQRLYWQYVNKMTLAGSDSLLSYRKDSTEFYHLNNCVGFYRKLTDGKIRVYDGVANVNEMPGFISGDDMVVLYQGKLMRFFSFRKFTRFIASIIPSYAEQVKSQGNNVNAISLFAAINKYNRGQ
jgi:hypothetical protein